MRAILLAIEIAAGLGSILVALIIIGNFLTKSNKKLPVIFKIFTWRKN